MASPQRQSGASLGPSSDIPDKLYFKIGEVAQLVGVQAHVLRYWEKEIPYIRPGKTVSNQRRYRRRDVEVFREIRRLLHQERYTLAGARQQMTRSSPPQEALSPDAEKSQASREKSKTSKTSEEHGLSDSTQLVPGPSPGAEEQKLERVRAGLRDLIRMAGEEP